MDRVTITGKAVQAHGLPGSGEIWFTPTSTGTHEGSLRFQNTPRAKIVRGAVEPGFKLLPGYYEVEVRPSDGQGPRWRTFVIEVPVGVTSLDIGLEAPVVEIDGEKWTRGAPGLSAYELARQEGYEGTLAEWLDETKGVSTGLEAKPLPSGILALSGPSVTRIGGLLVLFGEGPMEHQWSVNPLALRQGRDITSLWHDPTGSRIFSGFGDWARNGDETGVVVHDLDSGETEVLYFPAAGENATFRSFHRAGAYTEAIGTVRFLGGATYIPHIDGAGFWEGCGYISDEGGEWHEVKLPSQALHVFDVAETDQGLWMAGSAVYPNQRTTGPMLWFRPTGGDWHVAYRESVPPSSQGSGRYYSVTAAGGRVEVTPAGDGTLPAVTRSIRYIPPPGATSWPEILPAEALDISERPRTGSHGLVQAPGSATIEIDGWTYTGGPNGSLMKRRTA